MLKWRASCESLKVGRVWALSQMSKKAFEQGSALKCLRLTLNRIVLINFCLNKGNYREMVIYLLLISDRLFLSKAANIHWKDLC